MREALIALAVLVAGAIAGTLFKPSAEQMKPLAPEKPAGDAAEVSHHH